jgi:hypothetical protein
MSRLTLRLPETLHQQLAHLADSEGVSLNQYIVYALTRQIAPALQIIPESTVEQQQQAFQLLIKQLGPAAAEIEAVLATRESIPPEAELSADVVARLQERIRQRA